MLEASMDKVDRKLMLGEVLVREGLVTEKQLQRALAEQVRKERYLPLGEMCVHLKFLGKADLQKVLRKHRSHIFIGDLLVNLGLLGQEDLMQVLEFQQVDGKRIGRLLIEHGLITEVNLMNALSMQLGIPKLTPSPGIVQPSVLKGISKAFLVKHNCLPVHQDGDSVTVIMSDPLSDETLQSLEKIFRCRIEPAVASSEEIQKGIRMIYDDLKLADRPGEAKVVKLEQRRLVIDETAMLARSDDNTIEVTNFIVTEAIKDGATDIHIEPTENCLHVRFRVDGILRHKTDLPLAMAIPLTSRFKALSGLDIADTRRHQDGRLGAVVGSKTYDFRISTYPAIFGESLVIRVLRNQSAIMELEMLGFSPTQLELYKQLLAVPTGVTLVTGPTGNGKTTTLYASLLHLRSQDKKILTVEEPVECTMDGVIQGQVSEKTGLTYDTFVRSMLRQDPDVIMIGEMRDTASARAVVESCVAGHKVLTSCHTEEASGALLRMHSAGIETFMISSTVMAVFSQRLLRTLCPHCKAACTPGQDVLSAFRSIAPLAAADYEFYAPQGCTECKNTGYSGRTAVSEMLMVNNEIRDGIMNRVPTAKIRAIARRSSGLLSLQEDGFYKATRGVTSLEEVLRVVSCNDGDVSAPYSSEEIVSLSEAGSRAYLASGRSTSGSMPGGSGRQAGYDNPGGSIYSTEGASR
jgi:type IV pilus assembly protein PilB